MKIAELNCLSPAEAVAWFIEIGHAGAWSRRMAAARPFASVEAVVESAEKAWSETTEDDRLAAFARHARIGDVAALRERFSLSAREQGSIARASDETLEVLSRLNAEYECRFGFMFIVKAAGRSADEMLGTLRARLCNGRAVELANAGAEHLAIIRARLRDSLQEA